MNSHVLTPDTQAVLLLCGSLGLPRVRETPMTHGEYNQVAQWLQQEQLRPADLLLPEGIERVRAAGAQMPLGSRVVQLIGRGAALALAVEAWTNKGLWVVSRSDADYPRRLRARLGRQAPPLLYGVGERSLLEQGGLAIIGSRDADEAGTEFARSAALVCSRQGVPVISGGARGVDSAAMDTAIEAEGVVVGVMADSLARAAVAGKYRTAIREGRLGLVSPFDPDAGFNAGNAMQRNKAIYALSDLALVVSTTLEKGGTWNGATENLNRGWVPLFVRNEKPQLSGNRRLIELGGYGVARDILDRRVSVEDWLDGRELAITVALPLQAMPDRLRQERKPPETVSVRVADELPEQRRVLSEDNFPGLSAKEDTVSVATEVLPESRAEATSLPATTNENQRDLFEIVWPYLEQSLATPHTDREVADLFQIELKQAQAWLRRATEQGRLSRLHKPVRYIADGKTASALPLFDRNDPVL